MGRMLETLRLGDGRRGATASASNTAAPTVATPKAELVGPDRVVEWEIGDEVPFVEVGGPNKKVELSPGLQQHPAQPPQPPHAVIDKPVAAVRPGPGYVEMTETPPMQVAFEPWLEAAPTPLGISTEIVTYHQPDHAASRNYAKLFEQMRSGLKTISATTLLLVGARPQVGASTVLLNLAVVAAREELRTIVIEANGTHADLAAKLGRVAYAGLPEVMDGTLGLEQAIVKTVLPTLHLLPGGTPNGLTMEAMAWLCAWLRQRYDLIFIDGPTLDATAELAIQARHANGVYLVLPGNDEIAPKEPAQAITRMGGRLCGLIRTQFDV